MRDIVDSAESILPLEFVRFCHRYFSLNANAYSVRAHPLKLNFGSGGHSLIYEIFYYERMKSSRFNYDLVYGARLKKYTYVLNGQSGAITLYKNLIKEINPSSFNAPEEHPKVFSRL